MFRRLGLFGYRAPRVSRIPHVNALPIATFPIRTFSQPANNSIAVKLMTEEEQRKFCKKEGVDYDDLIQKLTGHMILSGYDGIKNKAKEALTDAFTNGTYKSIFEWHFLRKNPTRKVSQDAPTQEEKVARDVERNLNPNDKGCMFRRF